MQIAVAFSDIVTVATGPEVPCDGSVLLVSRKGRQSIFSALSQCLPHTTRDSKEKRPRNRHGVSLVELNKVLKSHGLLPVERKDRINGKTRWISKVWCKFAYFLRFKIYRGTGSSGQIGAGLTPQILETSV